MKISTVLQFDRAAGQMAKLTGDLAQQQARISSGEAFLAPREAPQAATTLLRLDALKANQETRLDLMDRAEARSQLQETALRSATDILIRLKELGLQAANDTYSPEDKRVISLEVRALSEELLSLANTRDAEGNAIFAGSATQGAAFSRDSQGLVTYVGDSTRVGVPVGENRTLLLARPGTDFFAPVTVPGSDPTVRQGFFSALDQFASLLEEGGDVSGKALPQLDAMLEQTTLGLARVGTDLQAVEQQRAVLTEERLQTDSLISDLRDLDFAEAITKLRADQLALEAAQSSFARIASQSLFNFLR